MYSQQQQWGNQQTAQATPSSGQNFNQRGRGRGASGGRGGSQRGSWIPVQGQGRGGSNQGQDRGGANPGRGRGGANQSQGRGGVNQGQGRGGQIQGEYRGGANQGHGRGGQNKGRGASQGRGGQNQGRGGSNPGRGQGQGRGNYQGQGRGGGSFSRGSNNQTHSWNQGDSQGQGYYDDGANFQDGQNQFSGQGRGGGQGQSDHGRGRGSLGGDEDKSYGYDLEFDEIPQEYLQTDDFTSKDQGMGVSLRIGDGGRSFREKLNSFFSGPQPSLGQSQYGGYRGVSGPSQKPDVFDAYSDTAKSFDDYQTQDMDTKSDESKPEGGLEAEKEKRQGGPYAAHYAKGPTINKAALKVSQEHNKPEPPVQELVGQDSGHGAGYGPNNGAQNTRNRSVSQERGSGLPLDRPPHDRGSQWPGQSDDFRGRGIHDTGPGDQMGRRGSSGGPGRVRPLMEEEIKPADDGIDFQDDRRGSFDDYRRDNGPRDHRPGSDFHGGPRDFQSGPRDMHGIRPSGRDLNPIGPPRDIMGRPRPLLTMDNRPNQFERDRFLDRPDDFRQNEMRGHDRRDDRPSIQLEEVMRQLQQQNATPDRQQEIQRQLASLQHERQAQQMQPSNAFLREQQIRMQEQQLRQQLLLEQQRQAQILELQRQQQLLEQQKQEAILQAKQQQLLELQRQQEMLQTQQLLRAQQLKQQTVAQVKTTEEEKSLSSSDAKPNDPNDEYQCKVCSIKISGLMAYLVHVQCKEHQANQAKQREIEKLPPSQRPKDYKPPTPPNKSILKKRAAAAVAALEQPTVKQQRVDVLGFNNDSNSSATSAMSGGNSGLAMTAASQPSIPSTTSLSLGGIQMGAGLENILKQALSTVKNAVAGHPTAAHPASVPVPVAAAIAASRAASSTPLGATTPLGQSSANAPLFPSAQSKPFEPHSAVFDSADARASARQKSPRRSLSPRRRSPRRRSRSLSPRYSPRRSIDRGRNRSPVRNRSPPRRSPRRSYSPRNRSPPRRSPLRRSPRRSPPRNLSPPRNRSPPRHSPGRGWSPGRDRGFTPPRRGFSPPRRNLSPPRGRLPSPPKRNLSPPRRLPSPPRHVDRFSPGRRLPSPPRRERFSPPRRLPSPPRRFSPGRRLPSPPRRNMSPNHTRLPSPPRRPSPPLRGSPSRSSRNRSQSRTSSLRNRSPSSRARSPPGSDRRRSRSPKSRSRISPSSRNRSPPGSRSSKDKQSVGSDRRGSVRSLRSKSPVKKERDSIEKKLSTAIGCQVAKLASKDPDAIENVVANVVKTFGADAKPEEKLNEGDKSKEPSITVTLSGGPPAKSGPRTPRQERRRSKKDGLLDKDLEAVSDDEWDCWSGSVGSFPDYENISSEDEDGKKTPKKSMKERLGPKTSEERKAIVSDSGDIIVKKDVFERKRSPSLSTPASLNASPTERPRRSSPPRRPSPTRQSPSRRTPPRRQRRQRPRRRRSSSLSSVSLDENELDGGEPKVEVTISNPNVSNVKTPSTAKTDSRTVDAAKQENIVVQIKNPDAVPESTSLKETDDVKPTSGPKLLDVSPEQISAAYGCVMNAFVPNAVQNTADVQIATEMLAELTQAVVMVVNNEMTPAMRQKFTQTAMRFAHSYPGHRLVQAFNLASSVTPEVMDFLTRQTPEILQRVTRVLQMRQDIVRTVLYNHVELQKLMMSLHTYPV